MGGSLLLESITAGTSVGLGCGSCCGTSISTALYGYLMAHVQGTRQCLTGFLQFILGKLLGVGMICILASLLGGSVMSEAGLLLGVPVPAIADLAMVLVGAWLLVGWVKEQRSASSCQSCHSSCARGQRQPWPEQPLGHLALLGMGFTYGISPCAPLVLVSSYAATLPVAAAAVLGCVFGLASVLSPGLFFLFLSGSLARRMREEIPEYLVWLRLLSYVLLVLIFGFHFFQEVFL